MRKVLAAVARTVKANVAELAFTLGLGLITVGLWRWIGLGALVAPGLALAWIGMPTRRSFVSSTPPAADRSSR